MNAWEIELDEQTRAYEPESVLVRSGRWSVRWMHSPATASASLQLWYCDRAEQFEYLIQSTIPQTFPVERLDWLFAEKMRVAEAMIEGAFSA